MNVVLLVVGIVVVVAAVTAAIVIPVAVRAKRRGDEFWAAFDAEVAAGAETLVLPRQGCVYRGGTGTYSSVKGNGRVALTSDRLVVRKLTGGVIEVPTARITGAHEAKVFQGSVVGGRVHVVVEIADPPAEVAFYVDGNDRWLNALIGLR